MSYGQNHYVASVTNYTASWLKVDNNSVIIPAAGGTHYVNLNTNLNVTATRPAWLVATQTKRGVLRLVCKANTSNNDRSATLTVTAKDSKSLVLNVRQMGKNTELMIDKDSMEFYPDCLSDSLYVCATGAFTFECPDWLKAVKVSDSLYKFVADGPIYDCASKQDTVVLKDGEGNVLKKVPATLRYHASYWFKKPCFAVISDIHFGDQKNQAWYNRMPRVFKTLTSYEPQLQYIFIVGDVSNSGAEDEYQYVRYDFNNSKVLNQGIKKIFVRGNHDHYNGSTGVSLYDQYITSQDNFYLNIKGYPFIAVGLDNSKYRGETFTSDTREFIKKNLADAARNYPDKPIFVFTHTLPYQTIIGSYENDYAAYDENLDGLFKPYPQVINFSGHTHMGLMDPHQIYQKDYTAVNDGSQKSDSHPTKFPNTYQLNADSEVDYNAITECLICHINENDEVVMERWNTARNCKYEKDWVVSPPFGQTSSFKYVNRTGGKNPWWDDNAAVKISDKTATTCNVTFPQAKDDNEGVNRYIISVVNAEGTKVRNDINQSSLQFMCDQQPSEITVPLTGLPTGVDLTVKVQARDYYELTSPTLTTTFKLTE